MGVITFQETEEYARLVDKYRARILAGTIGRDTLAEDAGITQYRAQVLIRAVNREALGAPQEAPREAVEDGSPDPAPRGHAERGHASESTLFDIALACRDRIKTGEVDMPEVMHRYGITQAQAYSVFAAAMSGVLDGAQQTDAPTPPLSKNATPETVELAWKGSVLVIPDLHLPFEVAGALDFCQRVRERYDCETIICVGDEVDNHAISFHDSDPDGFSAGHEAEVAMQRLKAWYAAFPECTVLIGNHSALPARRAYAKSIPKRMMRTYEEMWEAPAGWTWTMKAELLCDGFRVRGQHGTGKTGRAAAINWALANRMSTFIGHLHSHGGVQYQHNGRDTIFGLNVGCLVDSQSYSMAYAKDFADKPTLGCGVIADEGHTGIFVPMPA